MYQCINVSGIGKNLLVFTWYFSGICNSISMELHPSIGKNVHNTYSIGIRYMHGRERCLDNPGVRVGQIAGYRTDFRLVQMQDRHPGQWKDAWVENMPWWRDARV